MYSGCDVKITEKLIPFRPCDFTYENGVRCCLHTFHFIAAEERQCLLFFLFSSLFFTLFNRSDDGHKMMSMLLMVQSLDITADS